MTRQDAIWHANHVFNIVIERCINAQNLKDAREFDEAKQIVIEALEQELCDDCISRKETIRWVKTECNPYGKPTLDFESGKKVIEHLKQMPSIEALEKEPIIYCRDCKHWHEWENGTGSCHRSDMMWVGSDYNDYCSFAVRKGE